MGDLKPSSGRRTASNRSGPEIRFHLGVGVGVGPCAGKLVCVCFDRRRGGLASSFATVTLGVKLSFFFFLWDDEKVLKPKRKRRARISDQEEQQRLLSLLSALRENQAFGVMV